MADLFRLLSFAAAALPLAVACTAVETTSHSEEAQIITGTRDTGHPAVVTLQIQVTRSYALCTGTMIAANPETRIGYVLTAAHCLTNAKKVFVAAGNDMAATKGILNYSVVDFTSHPQYDGEVSSPYDVAIVRVAGVDATTATLGYASANDGLVESTSRVVSVGFGTTVRPGEDAGAKNTHKEQIAGLVTKLSASQIAVTYDAEGDICHGDSGGPVLAQVNGKELVVGVHSFVTGRCEGAGYSVRTQLHDAFIRSIIGGDAPALSCGLCKQTVASGNNVCAEARTKCSDDAECNGLRTCLEACTDAADPGACKTACSDAHPFGAAAYNTYLVYCACKACDDACSTDTTCAAYPKCGMALGASACTACGESACCAEMSACGQDGHCYRCTKNPETPGCESNELYRRLNSCRSTSCATQCAPQADAGNP